MRFKQAECFGHVAQRWSDGVLAVTRRAPTVPPQEVPRHTHDDAHFIIVAAGDYITEARLPKRHGGSVRIIFNPPETRHRDRFRTLDGEFLSASISAASFIALEPDLASCPGARVLDGTLAQRIAREAIMGGRLRAPATCDWEAICLELMGLIMGPRYSPTPNRPPWLDRAIEYCSDVNPVRVRVSQLAELAGVHPVYMARQFRRHLGCTPGQYLRTQRLARAALWLRLSRAPLSEVVFRTGFADQSQFTRSFGHAFGVSPASYRKQASLRAFAGEVAKRQYSGTDIT